MRAVAKEWNKRTVYGLVRQELWITAPYGQDEAEIMPPVLALCHNYRHAWVFKDIEAALYKADFLRIGFGVHSEPRAIHLVKNQWPN